MNINESPVSARENYVTSLLPQITEEMKEQKISRAILETLAKLDASPPDAFFNLVNRATLLSKEIDQKNQTVSKAAIGVLIGIALCVSSVVAAVFGRIEIAAIGMALAIISFIGSCFMKKEFGNQIFNELQAREIVASEITKIIDWLEKVNSVFPKTIEGLKVCSEISLKAMKEIEQAEAIINAKK